MNTGSDRNHPTAHRRPRIVAPCSPHTHQHRATPGVPPSPPSPDWKKLCDDKRLIVGFALAAALLIVAGAVSWRSGHSVNELSALGYPGIFLIMFLSGGSTFFPVGGQAAVLAAGSVWDPLAVGFAAGLGNSSGELLGYGAGRIGGEVLDGKKMPGWWSFLRRWLYSWGFFAILGLALLPNPIFDALGLLAGSMGYSAKRFWLACMVGNTGKYIGMAFLGGAVSWPWA